MITISMTTNESEEIKNKVAKPLLGIGIVSIVMLFAGLTSAYVVRLKQGDWLELALPSGLYISTVILVFSSVSLVYASLGLKKDKIDALKMGLNITFFLATAFIISQFYAWNQLVASGVFFAGSGSNAAGSFLYVLTGLHLAHLLGGIISLIFVIIRTYLGKYNKNQKTGFQVFEIYWHFLTGLWVYLLLFLLFIR